MGDREAERERRRQAALDELRLDACEDTAYDDITRTAAAIFQAPVALISIVDGDRQWFKSRLGIQATETPREVAFCDVTIGNPDQVLVVEDAAADPRFADNPLVQGEPKIRFYAAAPLRTSKGYAIGTVCVIDTKPKSPTEEQLQRLRFLADQVIQTIEARQPTAA